MRNHPPSTNASASRSGSRYPTNISGPARGARPARRSERRRASSGRRRASSAAPISGPSVVASRSGSSPARPVVSVGYSVEPYVRLHQHPNAAAPSRTIAGATPAPPSENMPHRRAVGGVERRVVDHRAHEHGRRDHHRDRFPFDEVERAARIPGVHQHRRDRARDRQQDPVGQPGDVGDGHREQQRLARPHRVRGRDGVGLDPQRLVRVHHALRFRRRARRPEDHRGVVDRDRGIEAPGRRAPGNASSSRTTTTSPRTRRRARSAG